MTVLLDGKKLATTVRSKLKERTATLRAKGIIPRLVVIMVGDNSASAVYVRNKKRAATEVGIEAVDLHLPVTTSQDELLALIDQYNQDPKVHGILVQLPLPQQIDEKVVTQAISPLKDVDGFHPMNVGQLFMGTPQAFPCTPRGIMELLAAYDIEVAGKNVVIIGRSNIVGRPMAALMVNHDATVTITHSKTQNLAAITRQADILVVAIGRGEFVTKDFVKPGAVVVDVGMNHNAEGKLVGDVKRDDMLDHASYLTPVPGGIGPMTIAMLMQQTVEFAERS